MDLVVLAAGGLLSANAGLAFWLGLAFLLLLFLLSKFAWGPITSALAERETTIEESISRAERANAEAQALLAQNDTARREAEAQAQTILRDAREEATKQREAARTELRDELAKERERATADIQLEKQQALAELRSEVAALAVGAAEKILQKEIDADAQRGLVDRFIADLPQN